MSQMSAAGGVAGGETGGVRGGVFLEESFVDGLFRRLTGGVAR